MKVQRDRHFSVRTSDRQNVSHGHIQDLNTRGMYANSHYPTHDLFIAPYRPSFRLDLQPTNGLRGVRTEDILHFNCQWLQPAFRTFISKRNCLIVIISLVLGRIKMQH
jgi:hypothetical protein